MEMQPLNLFEMFNKGRDVAREDQKRSALQTYLQPALGGDQAALSKVYGADPEAGMQAQQFASQQQKAQQDAKAAQLEQAGRLAAAYAQNPHPMLWKQLHALTSTLMPETAGMPDDLTDPHDQQNSVEFAKALGAAYGGATGADGIAIDGNLVDRHSGKVLFTAQPQRKIVKVEYADNGTPYNFYSDGSYEPARAGGQSAAMPAPTSGAGGAMMGDAIQSVESAGNPNAVSPKGARGLMQLMPATAREIEAKLGMPPGETDRNPDANRKAGEWYYQQQLQRFGSPELALAAYNGGPNRLARNMQAAGGDPRAAMGMMPAETQAYVPRVMGRAQSAPQGATGPTFGGKNKAPADKPETFGQPVTVSDPKTGKPVLVQVGNRGTIRPMQGFSPAPTAANAGRNASAAPASPVKIAQVNNVDRGIARIDSALKALDGRMVDTGPIDQYLVGATPSGKELTAAVGQIQESLLALTRVPGVGSQSDLEAKIAGLKFPSLDMPPEVNRRTLANLKAFVMDLKTALQGAQPAGNASGAPSGGAHVDDLLAKYGVK